MHQPYYKDLVSGEYKLPWTRMHALKDYYGMVRILEEFPTVRQTFNLVPSMMAQVEEYASGQAADPFLQLALKPAESLTDADKAFLLRHSFYSDPQRMIYRYPRYGELYDAWLAQKSLGSRSMFGVQEFRDLQMWSQLSWFDEDLQSLDPEIREWIQRGRSFTIADQRRMGEKQREIINLVLPEYHKLATSGQIEISTTPYYHPILPLVCDSNIASVSHPSVALPPRFRYPQDARRQLALSRDYCSTHFGVAPVGLWPSEGSVSDEVFGIAAELGYKWAATDSGVLNRTLSRPVAVDGLYRPYLWRQNQQSLGVIFRDHFLSDLIGFVYSKMDAAAAADDFLRRIRENCSGILHSGRDATVPIILDGENAWEYYDRNGRQFLRELYRRISDDSGMQAVTVSEALRLGAPEPIDHIFPGSWINANFDVWLGAEEDNQAWTQLLRARQTFDATTDISEEQRRMAYEELLIAEGSDWCWWYGPEHGSDNRPEFDQLYRDHLSNVYRALGVDPPAQLSHPILKTQEGELHEPPSNPIQVTLDGEVTSAFEWIGAGHYRPDYRSGAMHGGGAVAREMFYGSNGGDLFVRLDAAGAGTFAIEFDNGSVDAHVAVGRIVEMEAARQGDRFRIVVIRDGLPPITLPAQGWIEFVR